MARPKFSNMRMSGANFLLNTLTARRREIICRTISAILARETKGEAVRVVVEGELLGEMDVYGSNWNIFMCESAAPNTYAYIKSFPAPLSKATCYGLSNTLVTATKQLFFLAPTPEDVYANLPESIHKYLPEGLTWATNESMRADFNKVLEKYPTLGTDLFSVELSTFILG